MERAAPPHIGLVCLSFRTLGGRERACLVVARKLLASGARVSLVTSLAPDALRREFNVLPLRLSAVTNHGRLDEAARQAAALRNDGDVDLVVGFERLPGLDFLFSVDVYRPPPTGAKRLLARYRTLARLDHATFSGRDGPYCFFLTDDQARKFTTAHRIPADRYEVLPPVADPGRAPADPAVAQARAADLRRALDLPADAVVAISVATMPHTKGVDLALQAAARTDGLHHVVVGAHRPARITRQARKLGLTDRIRVVPYAENVMDYFAMADFLLHPARIENTGTVILESILAGTPALVTANCGYSPLVADNGAGLCVPARPSIDQIAAGIAEFLDPAARSRMTDNARTAGVRLRTLANEWCERVAARILGHAAGLKRG